MLAKSTTAVLNVPSSTWMMSVLYSFVKMNEYCQCNKIRVITNENESVLSFTYKVVSLSLVHSALGFVDYTVIYVRVSPNGSDQVLS
jgi:heme/copper-type cytochrome/quinol oxidase subunit 3